MWRSQWLIGVALTMLIAGPAMSQPPAEAMKEQQRLGIQTPIPSQYWLGLQLAPMPAALRSHLSLPDKEGLLVMDIVKDSPAAKAGVAQYDILLRAGEKPLALPQDMLAAVEAAKETKLKIELIRGGKPKTIELTPAKRPEQIGGALQAEQGDWETVQKWLEGMKPGEPGNLPPVPFRFNFVRPGMIVSNNVLIPKTLPGNMSVVITKEGDQPAKIAVKQGDKKWEITEKELDKLPADVRPYVEQMLGRGMVGIVGTPSTAPGAMPPGAGRLNMPSQPFPGLDPRIEKRFDEMERRMDKMMKMMEKMTEDHVSDAAPEQHEEK